jgi:hypothetical protein
VFNSGKECGIKEAGLVFIVNAAVSENSLMFVPLDERMFLHVGTNFLNLIVMNAYAFTEDKEDIFKDQFCHKLGQVYDGIPANDFRIILGVLMHRSGRRKCMRAQ